MNKNRFYAIDLFAGCGGLSEGFKNADFEIIAQIEMDKWVCETLRTRQLYHILKERKLFRLYSNYCGAEISKEDIYNQYPEIKESVNHRVTQAEFGRDRPANILSAIKSSMKFHNASRINVVLGGPPCQPYSLVGRARDSDRMIYDKRHFLYEYYLRVLEQIKPDFFVFENVPGLITARAKGEEVFSKMLDDFRNIHPSYEIAPSFDEYSRTPRQYFLNSVNYGIPQKRKRIVFIGYRKSLLSENPDIMNVFRHILKPVHFKYGGHTVSDAIGDLPSLSPGEGNNRWFGEYDKNPITPYQEKMREGSPGILNYRARTHMKSDLKRYKFFIEHHKNGNGAATLNDMAEERPGLLPTHKHLDKFIDRFKVQWWDYPSSTITAHICKDGHYYIHPEIHQCRSFTVREAARCQSFPDNFLFEGPRTEQFKQVGNAVPPRLALVIAKILRKELRQIYG